MKSFLLSNLHTFSRLHFYADVTTVDFIYDGAIKRTKKHVQSGKTVLYLGDHYEVENGVNIKYIFGGNLRLAQIKGSLTSSSTSYFHKDHLGSTAAVTDETGQKKESTTYEPFGSSRTQEGTAVSAYKFTDQELDNETNLYNYDAHLYDPVLGMFVAPDSIVPNLFDPQDLNRYTYCRNNPLIYTESSGHGTGPAWDGGPEENINNSGKIIDCEQNKQALRDYFDIKDKNTTVVKAVKPSSSSWSWAGYRTTFSGEKVRISGGEYNSSLFEGASDYWKGTISRARPRHGVQGTVSGLEY